jgi:uncharacterized protein YndB with AHSA1/START domain
MSGETALSLEITRRFEAPPERVFDAWLSKSWGNWIGPRDIKGEVTVMEPRVGGRYRIVMHRADNTTLAVEGVYRAIERPTKLVFTWTWDDGKVDTLVTLTFRAAGHGTLMTIHHEGFADIDRRDRHNQGWNSSFDKLAEHLDKGA